MAEIYSREQRIEAALTKIDDARRSLRAETREAFTYREAQEAYARAFAFHAEHVRKEGERGLPEAVARIWQRGIILPPGQERIALEINALATMDEPLEDRGIFHDEPDPIWLKDHKEAALAAALPDAAWVYATIHELAEKEDDVDVAALYTLEDFGILFTPSLVFFQICIQEKFPVNTASMAFLYKQLFGREYIVQGGYAWTVPGHWSAAIDHAFYKLHEGETNISVYECLEKNKESFQDRIRIAAAEWKSKKEVGASPMVIRQELRRVIEQQFNDYYEQSADPLVYALRETFLFEESEAAYLDLIDQMDVSLLKSAEDVVESVVFTQIRTMLRICLRLWEDEHTATKQDN